MLNVTSSDSARVLYLDGLFSSVIQSGVEQTVPPAKLSARTSVPLALVASHSMRISEHVSNVLTKTVSSVDAIETSVRFVPMDSLQ